MKLLQKLTEILKIEKLRCISLIYRINLRAMNSESLKYFNKIQLFRWTDIVGKLKETTYRCQRTKFDFKHQIMASRLKLKEYPITKLQQTTERRMHLNN